MAVQHDLFTLKQQHADTVCYINGTVEVCRQAEVVGSCSVLELFILVAIYRIKRRGYDSANFEMVHDEYCKLLEQGPTADRRSKAAALRAFEHLIASSLVSYVDGR